MSKNQIAELAEHGLIGLKIEEQRGRTLLCENKELVDFATTNYLGFDLHPDINKRGIELAAKWGPIVGWSRLEADAHIYSDLEKSLAKQLGASNVHLSHSVTLTGFSLLPWLFNRPTIICDKKVHSVVFEACRLARDHRATLVQFEHQDLNSLEAQLKSASITKTPILVAVDGVYSVSAERAPIHELQALCSKYGAWLYIDDAHGFGIFGESPTANNPYGVGGMGIVKHFTGSYSRTFYVSSFNKAFCTLGAFLVIPEEYKENIPSFFLSNIYSAPISPYSLGTLETVLQLNTQIGEIARKQIRKNVHTLVTGLRNLGLKVSNEATHPVVFVEIGELPDLIRVATDLKNLGVWAGLRPHPVVPKDQCGMRFAVSAAHSMADIDKVISAFREVLTFVKSRAA